MPIDSESLVRLLSLSKHPVEMKGGHGSAIEPGV
jgi:hypothetical protein